MCSRPISSWKLSFSICAFCLASIPGTEMLAASPAGAVTLQPGQDVAAAVRNAPGGTSFVFSPGVYRQQSIVPKDGDQFTGQAGAVLDGAMLLSMKPDGPLWSSPVSVAKSDPTKCLPDHPRCYILSDLFVDDQLQTPVASLNGLGPGSWYYDMDAQKAYVGVNPAGHKIELGMTPAAFSGNANGVQINHLIVEKYASPPQRGAIGSGGAAALPTGWTVSDSEIRWNHGAGIRLVSNGRIERCNVHHNGQLGIGGSGTNLVVVGNEIAFNNVAGYSVGWEAGATKFSKTEGLVLRSNYVHDNLGAGLWTDIDNTHVLMEKNTVLNNKADGIRHEIGFDAIIRNNLVRGNDAGIVVALSANVEVYGNVIEVPVNGSYAFRLNAGHRVSDSNVLYGLRNVQIHNNQIIYLGPKGHSGLTGADQGDGGITFDSNQYFILGGDDKNRWNWNARAQSLPDIRQLGLEQRATVSRSAPQIKDPTR